MKNSNIDYVTLKQAATLVGVNRMTLWRAVSRGEIEHLAPSEQPVSGKKSAIWVRRESLDKWAKFRHAVTPVQAVLEHPEQAASVQNVLEHPEQPSRVESALALQVIDKALDRAHQAEQRLEEALLRASLAERQAMALKQELQAYQRVLSEQAESLAEERANRLALELEQQRLKIDVPKAGENADWKSRWRRWLGIRTG